MGDGAAPGPGQQLLARQLIEVAASRRNRDPQAIDEVEHLDASGLPQQLQHRGQPLGLVHGRHPPQTCAQRLLSPPKPPRPAA